ncbi:MAG: NAD(P)/FAD-dependent oxidoreductase, partial [Pseudomonadota bacterium]|nr:NAD(P)/FAD-dependent oxidoreductase [Pseudomonadota bacterium]
MSKPLEKASAHDLTINWLKAFENALVANDMVAVDELFVEDSYWRDLVAFTWRLSTFSGLGNINAAMREFVLPARPKNIQLAVDRTPPRWVNRVGVDTIEAIFCFETNSGKGTGLLRLVPAPESNMGFAAWVLLTTLDEIEGHEEQIGERRPRGEEWSGGFGSENWMDIRTRQMAYEDRDPAVVVIGGSQCGLGIAASLGVLGVDTLVIDKNERVGDAWRKRYHNLVLHNEVFVDHMPYMPFPPNYPVYIPRDKIANWLEFYADTMEINVWGSAEFMGGSYNEGEERWRLKIRRGDGSERILHPRHVVMATGVSALPVMPDLPGQKDFQGELLHSSAYMSGTKWKGGKGIVLGTGNSGHDVAHDLHASGVDTKIVQRSSTLIISLKEAQRVYELYQQGAPIEDCDLVATASPYPLLVKGYQMTAEACKNADAKLLEGLAARGFRLDNGDPDDTGYQMKYLRRGGGYYFNVGASDLIVEGKIELLHHQEIERVVANGLLMKDGSVAEADVIVAATGYKNQQDVVR